MQPPAPLALPAASREALLTRIRDAVQPIPEVRLAYVFGSFARGEAFRDIDVAVLLEEPFSWRVPGRVADQIKGAVGESPRPLDVVPLNDASPWFRLRVADEGRVIFERQPREALDFWVRCRSEEMDRRSWLRAHGMEP